MNHQEEYDDRPTVCPHEDRVNIICPLYGDSCECESQDRLAKEIEQQEQEDAEAMQQQKTDELNWVAHEKGYPM